MRLFLFSLLLLFSCSKDECRYCNVVTYSNEARQCGGAGNDRRPIDARGVGEFCDPDDIATLRKESEKTLRLPASCGGGVMYTFEVRIECGD